MTRAHEILIEAVERIAESQKGTYERKWAKNALADAIDQIADEKVCFSQEKSLAIALLEGENAKLHKRIQELLETNTAYLERARSAERKLQSERFSMEEHKSSLT